VAERGRALLFLLICAALVAVAVLLHAASPPAPPAAELRVSAHRPPPRRLAAPALRRSARRFLTAFLRYEVGDRSSATSRALRATATPAFAAGLRRRPPRPSAAAPRAPARLGPLTIARLTPTLAAVNATARRAAGPEQLSFLFARTATGRWQASAPGE